MEVVGELPQIHSHYEFPTKPKPSVQAQRTGGFGRKRVEGVQSWLVVDQIRYTVIDSSRSCHLTEFP